MSNLSICGSFHDVVKNIDYAVGWQDAEQIMH